VRWYGRGANGRVQKYDDLPAQYHGNVNTDAPFGQPRGGRPALTEAEIRDVAAFLRTLTDADQKNAGPAAP
jgi:cytochrome c peroxidase